LTGESNYTEGTVYFDAETGSAEFVSGVHKDKGTSAYGYYNNTINATGFAVLEIQTQGTTGDYDDNKRLMYAAGYLEGFLTSR